MLENVMSWEGLEGLKVLKLKDQFESKALYNLTILSNLNDLKYFV